MQANGQQHDHFTDLDGMRGILACLVMLMHFGSDRMIAILTHGYLDRCEWDLSVDFFFVLSGFVLARSFENRPPSLGDYAVKRFFRLAPMFLIALFAVLICGVSFDRSTLLTNIFIFQSVVGLNSLNYPSWSIPFEMFLPALAVPMIKGWSTFDRARTKLIFAAVMLGAIVSAYCLACASDHRLLRALFGLGLGSLLYRLTEYKLDEWRGSSIVVMALFVSIMFVMLMAHRFPIVSVVFHPLVVATVTSGAKAQTLFSARICQALGRWSYSIYLLHIPMLMMTAKLLGSNPVDHNPILKVVLAFTTVGVAAGAYRFIECPLMLRATSTRKSMPSPLRKLLS